VATAASTIHMFTGNNIAPKGDLTSRSLKIRLEVDRPDPENRPFKHPDPVGWTEAHRGQILGALYTILLGNPELSKPISAPAKTRFKVWWRVVGAAIEHAAMLHNGTVDFRELFLSQEEDDEESASLADMLSAMAWKWPGAKLATAGDISKVMNVDQHDQYVHEADKQLAITLREFLFPKLPPGHAVSAKSVASRLKRHVGEPVKHGDKTLILKTIHDAHTKQIVYYVEVK
jgi:hypothetical protein